jgi:SPP1 family predicted phage head-tail adaptor
MRAGKLRHRLTLQSPTVTRDSYGAETIAWTDERTVWGSVEPLEGREYLEARATTQTITHQIRIRYQKGKTVHPSWRVSYDSRTFVIESVMNRMERDMETIIMARENV